LYRDRVLVYTRSLPCCEHWWGFAQADDRGLAVQVGGALSCGDCDSCQLRRQGVAGDVV